MRIQLQGVTAFSAEITPPPSKSQTMRAFVFAALAKGESVIFNPLISPDTLAMLQAIQALGAEVCRKNDRIKIKGTGSDFTNAAAYRPLFIDAKNSGLVLRLIGAVSGLRPGKSVITGDSSVRQNRVVAPLISGLKALGGRVQSRQLRPPLAIRGPIHPGKIIIDGQDSQPVSAFLIACSFLKGNSEILVKNAQEKPWIDVTLAWLDFLKIKYQRKGYDHFKLFKKKPLPGFKYTVPADFSSLSYPLALAFLTGSSLHIKKLDFQDSQGDKKFISLLQKMGAVININTEKGSLTLQKAKLNKAFCLLKKDSGPAKDLRIDASDIIDMVPLLAALACFCSQKTCIYNAESCRFKESDRLAAMARELKKMGACIQEKKDGLLIYPSSLKGARLYSHQDHRIALCLAVTALSICEQSVLEEAGCIDKTYPGFFALLKKLKQNLKILENK